MPSEPRCEPPEGLRDQAGWHEIRQGKRRAILYWSPVSADQEEPYWTAGVLLGVQVWTARHLTANGWRYLMPVPDPANIAALVRAARRLERFSASDEGVSRFVLDMRSALQPFGDIPDA